MPFDLSRLAFPDKGWLLFRVNGLPVSLHPGAAILASAVVASTSMAATAQGTPVPTALAMGTLTYSLLFASLLAHELGHVFAGRRCGVEWLGIHVTAFGMAALMVDDLRSPVREAVVALAGPLVSLLLACCAAVAFHAIPTDSWAHASGLAFVALNLNVAMAAFNLMPCYPMDGGRVVRAAAWAWTGDLARATRFAGHVGMGVAAAIAGLGIFLVVSGNPFGALMAILAPLMVLQARRDARRLTDVHASEAKRPSARDLMRPFGSLDGGRALYLLPGHGGPELVAWDGSRMVARVAAGLLASVPPNASPSDVLAAIDASDGDLLPLALVRDGQPLGFVTRQEASMAAAA